MNRWNADSHIKDAQLADLLAGRLDNVQSLAVAKHIADCASCAQKLADFATLDLAAPSRGFTEQVLDKIAQTDNAHHKAKVLYVYGSRIAACLAVIVALSFSNIVSASSLFPKEVKPPASAPAPVVYTVPAPDEPRTFWGKLGACLADFKDSIFNSEENNHDPAEK